MKRLSLLAFAVALARDDEKDDPATACALAELDALTGLGIEENALMAAIHRIAEGRDTVQSFPGLKGATEVLGFFDTNRPLFRLFAGEDWPLMVCDYWRSIGVERDRASVAAMTARAALITTPRMERVAVVAPLVWELLTDIVERYRMSAKKR
jgi:hypothetical protein